MKNENGETAIDLASSVEIKNTLIEFIENMDGKVKERMKREAGLIPKLIPELKKCNKKVVGKLVEEWLGG